MTDEVEPVPPARSTQSSKAIPHGRDRLQSRTLVWLLVPALVLAGVFGVLATSDLGGRYKVAGISLAFAAAAAALRSATLPGAVCGALVCFSITWWTRDLESPLLHSALPPLFALFVLTYAATRAGRKQKQLRGLAERSGGRSAGQVLANLGAAALVVTPLGAYAGALAGLGLPIPALTLSAAALAALAEATADTVSSEIGQAFGRRTYLLTSFRRVHRGTDGGVSLLGTAAGVLGTLAVVLLGSWSLHLPAAAGCIAFAAALLGFVADSLLGATVERKGWIGNDLVNFLSTTIAAFTALLFAHLSSYRS